MYLKNLRLRNFRSLSKVELAFSPAVNVIIGDNAQGKSSLLEAIYLLSTGQSFRGASFKEMLQKQEEYFFIQADLLQEELEDRLRVTFDGKEKKFHHDETSYNSFSMLLSLFPLTLYSPEDVELISGSPAIRRRAMNIHLAKSDTIYLYHLFRYVKALRHRNALLKKRKENGIAIFEEELAKSGAYLTYRRFLFCIEMQPLIQKYYSYITDHQEMPTISYKKAGYYAEREEDIYENLLSSFQQHRNKEMELGHSIIGPHRDDFSFSIEEMNSKPYASEGQKRSLAYSFRMAEWEKMQQEKKRATAFAIDDFGSHLDEKRRKKIEELLPKMGQVFLTAPDASFLSLDIGCYYKVEKGSIYTLSSAST